MYVFTWQLFPRHLFSRKGKKIENTRAMSADVLKIFFTSAKNAVYAVKQGTIVVSRAA